MRPRNTGGLRGAVYGVILAVINLIAVWLGLEPEVQGALNTLAVGLGRTLEGQIDEWRQKGLAAP